MAAPDMTAATASAKACSLATVLTAVWGMPSMTSPSKLVLTGLSTPLTPTKAYCAAAGLLALAVLSTPSAKAKMAW